MGRKRQFVGQGSGHWACMFWPWRRSAAKLGMNGRFMCGAVGHRSGAQMTALLPLPTFAREIALAATSLLLSPTVPS